MAPDYADPLTCLPRYIETSSADLAEGSLFLEFNREFDRQLRVIREESDQDNWDGEGAKKVEEATYVRAAQLAAKAAFFAPCPLVNADPYGRLLLEWFGPPGYRVMVAVPNDGPLSVVVLREDAHVQGKFPFAGGIDPFLEKAITTIAIKS